VDGYHQKDFALRNAGWHVADLFAERLETENLGPKQGAESSQCPAPLSVARRSLLHAPAPRQRM